MKKILTLMISVIVLTTITGFDTAKEPQNPNGSWYYCYIGGTFHGDSDMKGYYFSHLKRYKGNDRPTSNCTQWAELAEERMKDGFKADCSSYKVYGPFDLEYDAYKHHRNKRKGFAKTAHLVMDTNRKPF